MDGKFVVRLVERTLAERGITKAEFYENCGISSATFSQWRAGLYEPSISNLEKIQDYLGIRFTDEFRVAMAHPVSPEEDLLETIRTRPDLGILLNSAKDVPPSSVYELVSKLEKMKEDAEKL